MASTPSSPSAAVAVPDGVDGVPFTEVERPFAPAEVARILRSAADGRAAVTPFGGGTKLALGNTPARAGIGLSLEKLDRVLHYEPTDLTLSVEAGARFAAVAEILAAHGQALPIETPDGDRATIGGLIATALTGPRRLGSGTLRDLLIGVTVAYPDGTLGKAGGLVVKNVTGFDLMRLHHGALGTLGVVVSANFKVLPRARSEATLVSDGLPLDAALGLAGVVGAGRFRPIALEVVSDGGDWRVAARIEGRPQSVQAAVSVIGAVGAWASTLSDDAGAAWWHAYVERQSLLGGDVVIRLGVEPRQSGRLATALAKTLADLDMLPSATCVSAGLGSALVRLPAEAIGDGGLVKLQAVLQPIADTVTILRAPVGLKREVDVWGRVPETIGVMRALKSEYDPNNTLNPGRFVDRI